MVFYTVHPNRLIFYEILESLLLNNANFIQSECILLGDFNTDVSSSHRKCPLVTKLKSICAMFSLKQIIQDFTRISSSSTTIDLILVSDCEKISQSGVIDCCISDHQMTFCTRKIHKVPVGKHNTATMRSLKHYSKEAFQQTLLGSNWNNVLLSDNVTDAWINFKQCFISCLDNIAPVKSVRIKQRTEEWVDSEVLQCIKDRDNAFYIYRKNRTDDNLNRFKSLRNKANFFIANAKKNFFKSSVEANQNDSKSLWKSLKQLGMPSTKSQSSSNVGLNIDGTVNFDKIKVAEKFNQFYTSVADNLVRKLPKALTSFGSGFVFNFYSSKGVLPESFSFAVISEGSVLKYLNTLCPTKATGLDGIPARFVKDSAPIIAEPLSHIINLSIIQGVVPDDLKTARVVPIYKKNDKTDVGNYRPVSILSIISKIMEKAIYDQLEQHLVKKQLLYDFQSGFRHGFSTDTCLVNLTDFIRLQMDKGHLVGMLLLDLQKAFGTVNHSILLMKLQAIGLSNSALSWFRSYLSDRQQLVEISGTRSSSKRISCGVPQGSILGPLLFLIYVNDMSAVVKNKLLLYADDSAILVSAKNKSDIEIRLSEDLQSISQWLICNKLSLHLGKTESILFGSKQRLKSNSNLNIQCNGHTIGSTSSVKYLGATLDQSLSFDIMARSIIKKANDRLKFLYRKSSFLTQYTKRLLINSLIQCHFDYASSAWFNGLTQELKNKLQVTQNKLVRFVLNLNPRSHVGRDEFSTVKWLPVQDRVHQIILCHVYKIHTKKAPSYMHENFNLVSNVHGRNTRFRVKALGAAGDSGFSMTETNRYSVPSVKGFGHKSFAFIGCKLWNGLPQDIRDSKSLHDFKLKVKERLLTQIDF